MDKNTLSHYGWIVVLVLILAVMLALATPFGEFIAGAFKSTYVGFGNVTDNAFGVIGLGNGGSGDEGQTPTNGKLAAPYYVGSTTEDDVTYTLSIMTSDTNTEGYYVYLKDDLVATIGVGETYTFPGTTGDEAIPVKVIAFANGYENSDAKVGACYYGAGLGCEMYHYAPTVSLNGTTLTVASNNEAEPGIIASEVNIYVDGTRVLYCKTAQPEGTDFDLSAYLTGDAHEIKVQCFECEVCNPKFYYEGGMPATTVAYGNASEQLTLNAPIISSDNSTVTMVFDNNATNLYLIVNGMDFGSMPLADMENPYNIPIEIWLNDAGILQVGENTIVAYVTDETDTIMSGVTTYTFTVSGNELPAPMVSIEGSVLTVSPVLGAESYEVVTIDMYGDICKEGIILTNNNLSVDLADYFNQNYDATFEIGVIAKGDGYADTLSQNTVIYTIEVIETKVSAFTVKYEAGCMVIEGAENATSFNMTATVGTNNINETFNGHTYNFYQIQGSRPATNFTPTVTYTFIGMADGLENSDPVTLTITFDEVKADLAAHPEAYQ